MCVCVCDCNGGDLCGIRHKFPRLSRSPEHYSVVLFSETMFQHENVIECNCECVFSRFPSFFNGTTEIETTFGRGEGHLSRWRFSKLDVESREISKKITFKLPQDRPSSSPILSAPQASKEALATQSHKPISIHRLNVCPSAQHCQFMRSLVQTINSAIRLPPSSASTFPFATAMKHKCC